MIKKLILTGVALLTIGLGFASAGNYGQALENTIVDGETPTINNLSLQDRWQDISIGSGGPEEIRDFLIEIFVKVLIPIFVLAGVVVAIIGFYKLIVSDGDDEIGKATDYITRGITGIILMVSAGFITTTLVGTDGAGGIFGDIVQGGDGSAPSGALIAEALYNEMLYPFISVLLSILLGILFIMLVIHAFRYLFSGDADVQSKSFTILVYNTIGILVMVLAKTIVEIVYGKYDDVINGNVKRGGEGLGGIALLLSEPDYERVFAALNWIMSLTTFIIMILIIYQGYMLLTNPDQEENMERLKKSLTWIFIGIFVIGGAYVISSMLVIT